jgi:hypothetical protein
MVTKPKIRINQFHNLFFTLSPNLLEELQLPKGKAVVRSTV